MNFSVIRQQKQRLIKMSFLKWYSEMLTKKPLLTKMVTSGILAGLGDQACQTIEGKKRCFWRTGTFAAVGSLYIGPMLHLNYSRILPYLVPETSSMAAFRKIVFDQAIFAPIITAGFFIVINVIELQGIQKGLDDLRSKLWETLIVNWKIWIPANLINFAFVPIPFQVLFANFVSIGYNTALSFIHNKSHSDFHKEAESQEEQAWALRHNKMQIEKLNEGVGQKVPRGALVKVHYTGKLQDGTVFDSSVERGQPISFTVGKGQVIRAWDEGIVQLKKGQRAILTCPPDMAYGKRGAGPIPPNSTLIFEVEIVDWRFMT